MLDLAPCLQTGENPCPHVSGDIVEVQKNESTGQMLLRSYGWGVPAGSTGTGTQQASHIFKNSKIFLSDLKNSIFSF